MGALTSTNAGALVGNVPTANLASGTDASNKTFFRGDSPNGAWAFAQLPLVAAGGTVDAITADFTPNVTLSDQMTVAIVSVGANTSTTPTFAPDGLTAHTITMNGGQALAAGSIGAAGFVAILEYNLANTRWELLNPVAPSVNWAVPGTIGSTTPNTGAFTQLQATGAGTAVTSNVHVGTGAGGGNTTGNQNTSLGINAGVSMTTGHGGICIGYQADHSGTAANCEIVIGTTNTGAALSGLGGNTAFISANGGGTYNGANVTTWATTSDARIKTNIADLPESLPKILALRPREFDYLAIKNPDGSIKHDVSFIAQEYMQVFPEQVMTHISTPEHQEIVQPGFIAAKKAAIEAREQKAAALATLESDPENLHALSLSKMAEPTPPEPVELLSLQMNLIPYLVKALQELNDKFETYKAAHP